MNIEQFMNNIENESEKRILKLHHFAKRMWKDRYNPLEAQNKCLDFWEQLKDEIGSKINPIVPVNNDHRPTNLIFGSGSFSTGEFQIQQYNKIINNIENPPVQFQGIITNKSIKNNCRGSIISKKYKVPFVELDFIDWYRKNIDDKEVNPIRASRYWYSKEDPNRPSSEEIKKRFNLRQNQFHKELGEKISEITEFPTDIVSLRGYNFQFCKNICKHQKNPPHINDTHPADLTYIDPISKEKLYPGWQAGAIQLMINDNHTKFRGSLIEVDFMDKIEQIDTLDEGALLGIGKGVTPSELEMNAKEIQNAMKIIDDYFFCTLEPTGIILFYGITEKPIPITFQTLDGKEITINQKAIVVGNKLHSGINVWGKNFEKDIKELEDFFLH